MSSSCAVKRLVDLELPPPSNHPKRLKLLRNRGQRNRIPHPHDAAGDHHRHHAAFADHAAVGGFVEHGGHQAGGEAVDVFAGAAEAGHFDQRFVPQPQAGTAREAEQVDPAGRNVLTQLAGANAEALFRQFIEQFGMHQVDLAQVGRIGVFPLVIAVLNRAPKVGIALDPEARQQG